MSTRAQIGIEGGDVLIYQHGDGNPKFLLPTLSKFVNSFMDKRGYDPHYMAARLCEHLGPSNSYGGGVLGLGVGTEFVGDIVWFYWIRENGDIVVVKAGHSDRVWEGDNIPGPIIGTLTLGSPPSVVKVAAARAEKAG